MSDPTAQEPTMEEILASIRRIISEDDAPAGEAPATQAAPHEQPKAAVPAPAAAPVHLAAVPPAAVEDDEEEQDVLDLTEPAPTPKETHGDLDVFDAEPAPKPKAAAPPPPPPEPVKPAPVAAAPVVEPAFKPSVVESLDEDRLISGGTENQAASHFGKLAQSIAMPSSGRQLEDVVAELLKPLLKDWLDQHLPAIVEEKVQAEVERIARRRV